MAYITLDDVQMYYEEHGTLSGPPLLLLHGFVRTGADWESQVAPLSVQPIASWYPT